MFDDGEIERLLLAAIAQVNALTGRYLAGEITWEQFKAGVFRTLRNLYYDVGRVAGGGELTDEQRRIIEAELAEQFYPHGEGFSLTEKFEDRAEGRNTWGQFAASLVMYMRSSRSVAYLVKGAGDDGDRLAVRRLRGNDHCNQCLLYAALPPRKLSSMVVPGRFCSCYTNCLCIIEFADGLP